MPEKAGEFVYFIFLGTLRKGKIMEVFDSYAIIDQWIIDKPFYSRDKSVKKMLNGKLTCSRGMFVNMFGCEPIESECYSRQTMLGIITIQVISYDDIFQNITYKLKREEEDGKTN